MRINRTFKSLKEKKKKIEGISCELLLHYMVILLQMRRLLWVENRFRDNWIFYFRHFFVENVVQATFLSWKNVKSNKIRLEQKEGLLIFEYLLMKINPLHFTLYHSLLLRHIHEQFLTNRKKESTIKESGCFNIISWIMEKTGIS